MLVSPDNSVDSTWNLNTVTQLFQDVASSVTNSSVIAYDNIQNNTDIGVGVVSGFIKDIIPFASDSQSASLVQLEGENDMAGVLAVVPAISKLLNIFYESEIDNVYFYIEM